MFLPKVINFHIMSYRQLILAHVGNLQSYFQFNTCNILVIITFKKCLNNLLVANHQLSNLICSQITCSNPNNLWRMTLYQANIIKIRIKANYYKIIFPNILPYFIIFTIVNPKSETCLHPVKKL